MSRAPDSSTRNFGAYSPSGYDPQRAVAPDSPDATLRLAHSLRHSSQAPRAQVQYGTTQCHYRSEFQNGPIDFMSA